MGGYVPAWAPKIVIAYLLYITIFYYIIINAHNVNFNAYSLTDDQKAIIGSQNADALTFLYKLYVLSTLSTSYLFLGILTFIFSAGFIIAIAVIVRALLPIP